MTWRDSLRVVLAAIGVPAAMTPTSPTAWRGSATDGGFAPADADADQPVWVAGRYRVTLEDGGTVDGENEIRIHEAGYIGWSGRAR